jgi:hypothetical protein
MSTFATGSSDLNSNLYNLYIQACRNLAQTLVVKFDQVGQALNNLVLATTGVVPDSTDRTTWKYYQNISGVYHFIDSPMMIESLDTQATILFDKTVLQSHPTTLEAYAFGSYYYDELLAKYPSQEMLILGILYPCDISTAINADDGTILSYPPDLVESTETDFIAKLQTWSQNWIQRWVIQGFANTDNLYIAAYYGQFVLLLVAAILDIRLRACKTNQAHSYHIGQYLRSRAFLDFYLAELTQEQTLDFYRNINYYLRNAGFESTFETLVDLLMTKRGLPVYQYMFKQNAASINYVNVTDLTSLVATPTFERHPLNSPALTRPLTNLNLADVFALTNANAPGNPAYETAYGSDIMEMFKRSPQASLATKVIETTLGANTTFKTAAPQEMVFNQWLAMTCMGVYTGSFSYTPPGTSIPLQLTQPQAVALWIYAMNKALEPEVLPAGYVPISVVPPLKARWIPRITLPTFSDLRSITATSVLSDALLQEALGLCVTVPQHITSVSAFANFTSDIFAATQNQFLLYSFQSDSIARGQLQYVCDLMYNFFSGPIPGMDGRNYIDVLSEMGFTPSNYSAVDFYNLTTSLFEAATGATLNDVANPANIQAAMMQLLTLLSSYSLQFVSSATQDEVVKANRPEVRVYNVLLEEKPYYGIFDPNLGIVTNLIEEDNTIRIDYNEFFPLSMPAFTEQEEVAIDLNAHDNSSVTIVPTVPAQVPLTLNIAPSWDPQASFNALSPSQQTALLAAAGLV